ncbi:MAG: RhoGEF domain-containing protein [Parachlamydiales bacterium]|jgi:hypothetical protein
MSETNISQSQSIYNTSNITSWSTAKPSSSSPGEKGSFIGRNATVQSGTTPPSVQDALKHNIQDSSNNSAPLTERHHLSEGSARPETDAKVPNAAAWTEARTHTTTPHAKIAMGAQRTEKFQQKQASNQVQLQRVVKETVASEQSYRNDLDDLLGYFDVSLNDPQFDADLAKFNAELKNIDPEAKPLTREDISGAKQNYQEARETSQAMQALMPKENMSDTSFITGKEFMQTFSSMAQTGAGQVVLGYETKHIHIGSFLRSQPSVQSHIKGIEAERQAANQTEATDGGRKALTKEPTAITHQPIQRMTKYQLLAREMAKNSPENSAIIKSRIGDIESVVDQLNVVNSVKDLQSSAEGITKGGAKENVWTKFTTALTQLGQSKLYKENADFKNKINSQVNMVYRHNLENLSKGGFFHRIALKLELAFGSLTKQEFKDNVEYQINFIQKSGITGNTDSELFRKAREETEKLLS